MFMYIVCFICCLVLVRGAAPADNLKDQFCTDPRTMRKHGAYTEWADAYSCTRHRCQPGGRNLAIYTVGCKRVEAPESAIECEEVVEDTNMQFPYCCTRLRCLVVVRGEVWTRVLGQPWETLPAAPWSHMYKMKKPPPVDGDFQPKGLAAAGPIYELSDPASDGEKVMRARTDKDRDKRPLPATPDIVIALSTNSEKKPSIADIESKLNHRGNAYDGNKSGRNEIDAEEAPAITEKVPEIVSEERMHPQDKRYRAHEDSMTSDKLLYLNGRGPRKSNLRDTVSGEHLLSDAEKIASKGQKAWDRVPQETWSANSNTYTQPRAYDVPNDYDRERDPVPKSGTFVYHGDQSEEKRGDKSGSLQTLVNAIGTRMRDIENVVQQMSEKVHPPNESRERMRASMPAQQDKALEGSKQKKTSDDNYNRYPGNVGSRYLRTGSDSSTEPPLYADDTNINGYYSDPSNTLVRRANRPKEPAGTYMVPVNLGGPKKLGPELDEPIKQKKRTHKKKKSKHGKKKHHGEDRETMKSNKNPPEQEKNTVSLEDSTDFGTEEEPSVPARRYYSNYLPYQQVREWGRSLRAHRLARMQRARASYRPHVGLERPPLGYLPKFRYRI